ncbi:hypothetical protein GII30_22100 [Gordonia amarae]|uniref:Uncharacterized protein n=2 Tax=Gordonia amarae TaxID=36821 RepID=G7GLW7_9ACTN|nr:hypothetical protein [Gordonia amarae]MCS3876477.1 hypothetical protein [Gordonia amarae]QHN19387.1 hypothetical protein GII35_22565 [Gordonia amarae]QHN23863.1 hypothetical protein GII34_22065 [Gordonia amarae]QHN32773.1 hypothetical protein GII32_22395 [Gordonia amarae]QHN41492.1 hypothetical protein GII30_22100 [Gordonia amarae]
MTPFMWKVQELLEGDTAEHPDTEPSVEVSVAEGADTQVIVRSLAEQLVCEANAVLAWHAGEHPREVTLVDDTGPGTLAFTLACGERSARIETQITGHTATARLIGTDTTAEPRRLADEDQLQSLVLELIAD